MADSIEQIIATTQSALGEEDDDDLETSVPYTLKEYSFDFFRVPKSRTLGSIRRATRKEEELWVFSRDPIRKPLLKRLGAQAPEIQQRACQCFLDILLIKSKNYFNMSFSSRGEPFC